MTADEIVLASEKCLFASVFHYYSKPLVLRTLRINLSMRTGSPAIVALRHSYHGRSSILGQLYFYLAVRESAAGKGGMFGNVIRISPPMNVSRTDVDEFVRRLDHAFQVLG
jgi:4-aminobutyrate aminotransferase-like enzyme